MPSRILKESICTSDNLDMLDEFQETFFYRLIVNCDDYGRMDARLKILRSKLFPLKDVPEQKIADALKALKAADLIILYEVSGKPYLQMKTWEDHQQVRAHKSKYPSPKNGQLKSDDINCNQLKSDDIKCPRNPIQSNPYPNPKDIDEEDDEEDDYSAGAGAREEETEWKSAVETAVEAQCGRKAAPAEISQIATRAQLFGLSPGMVALAIKTAAENHALNLVKYVTKIFDDWQFEHVTTPEEAEELTAMRFAAKGQGLYVVDSHEDVDRMREARERRKAEHESKAGVG